MIFPTTPSGVKILGSEKIVAGYFVRGVWVPVTFGTLINLIIAESKGMPLPETFERVNGFNAFGYVEKWREVFPLFNQDGG
jgi:hypothetical protein